MVHTLRDLGPGSRSIRLAEPAASAAAAGVAVGLLLALALVPIWSVRRFPTQDGPSHVYNAYVLTQLLTEVPGPVAEVFAVRSEPVPNWMGHGILVGLMVAGLHPATAERVFVSLYLIGMTAGTWFLLRSVAPRQVVWAPLAIPLAFNFPFFMGFYNFAGGVPAILVLIGLLWRWRDHLNLRRGISLAALLVLLDLAHLVNVGIALVAMAAVGVIGARQPTASACRLALVALPAVCLIGRYFLTTDRAYLSEAPIWRVAMDSDDTPSKLLSRVGAAVLWPTAAHRPLLGLVGLGSIVGGALAVAVRRLRSGGPTEYLAFCRDKGPLAVAAAELMALALLLPQNWGRHGGCFTERLAVIIGCLALACLPTPRSARGVLGILVFVVGLVGADLVAVNRELVRGDGVLSAVLDPLAALPPNTRVLPLLLDSQIEDQVLLLEHLVDHLCLRPGVVDWSNYEAHGFCFPVMFRPEVVPPDLDALRRGGGTQTRMDLARTDVVLVGPACPLALREQVAAEFPHARPTGRLTLYSRDNAPTP